MLSISSDRPMAERNGVYFVSDVHLGLKAGDPEERESRFVAFLKAMPRETTKAVYLLGDIWDFWYEYKYVIPKEGMRVISELIQLIDAGVEVYFFEGNHDMWAYSFFEQIGVRKLPQPSVLKLGDKVFCAGHGDALGGAHLSYRLMRRVFHSRTARALFSSLHPTLAFGMGRGWSESNRKSHKSYRFRGKEEPLYKFAVKKAAQEHIDCFVFGHFHDKVDLVLPGGERFCVLKDWMEGGTPHLYFDCKEGSIVF